MNTAQLELSTVAPAKPAHDDLPAMRRRRFAWLRRHPLWLAVVMIALVTTAYWLLSNDSAPTSKPLFATVEYGDIENAVTAAGTLQPSKFVDVGAQVSGQLDTLLVEVGDVVGAGDLVAEIDATVQINRVEASKASLKALEAQLSARAAALALAEANAERQTRLMDEDATSSADFDSAINTLASAQSSLVQLQSNIAQSRASLASDEATLGYSKIYAPIGGTVVTIDKKEGMTLNASQQAPVIMRIADLSTMTVQAEVSEADVGKLASGMDVYFTTLGSGDRRWYGNLRQILPTPVIENNVVLYTALFDVDNSDKALLSEMTAQIFFVTASAQNVLKVPVGALTYLNESAGPAGAAQAFAAGADQPRQNGGGMRGDFEAMSQEDRAARIRERMASLTEEEREARIAQFRDRTGAGVPRARRDGRGARATVQIVGPDGELETREVQIGVTSRISAEVLSGLDDGDQVVAGIIQATQEESSPRSSSRRFFR
jgi:macrolide-specific efflux system membrane fusion protein